MTPHLPLWWHGCGIALVAGLFLLQRRARAAGILAVCLIRLPGVVLHELAHLLTGLLLGAEPSGFSLVPKRRGSGWTLGSVAFRRVNVFNAVPIAFAPLGLVPLAWYLHRSWFSRFPVTLGCTLILYAALFLLVCNALPSRQDLAVACNWKSVLLYGGVVGIGMYVRCLQ
jgi:hypothetical protein